MVANLMAMRCDIRKDLVVGTGGLHKISKNRQPGGSRAQIAAPVGIYAWTSWQTKSDIGGSDIL